MQILKYNTINHVKKTNADMKKRIFMVMMCSIILSCIYALKTKVQINDEELFKRPDYSDEQKCVDIIISPEGFENIEMNLAIDPVEYGEDQINLIFDKISENIGDYIKADNESLLEIRSNILFPDMIEKYPVSLEWYSSDYSIIDYNGCVHNENMDSQECKYVTLTLVMEYGVYKRQISLNTIVMGKIYDQDEKVIKEIQNAVKKAVVENKEKEYAVLPESVEGIKLNYSSKLDLKTCLVFPVLGVIVCFMLIMLEKEKKKKSNDKRLECLKLEYSGIIHKLVLLMGAGMTIRMAWEKITSDYIWARKRMEIDELPAYEEMRETVNQLRTGVPAYTAYGMFGKKCNTKEYLKLSTLIVQNIRKGSDQIVGLLQLEASEAFEERKNLARKAGEEAGTKMLGPMILMLLVVMTIIMVPAVMKFNG